jgi:hypothetical protein
MKRLIALTLGIFAALSVTAATAAANDREEVRSWPSDARFVVYEPGITIASDQVLAPGARVYYLSDDPTYDLSGAGRTLYLVDDGGAYRSDNWSAAVAFVRAGGGGDVVSIPAEYRQDWMSVAAGDRPVRCLTPVRMSVPTPTPYAPSARETSDYDRYKNGTATYTSNGSRSEYRQYAAHRKHRAALTAQRRHRPAKRHYYSNAEFTPAATPAVTAEDRYVIAEATVERLGNDLFQIGNSWYTTQDGSWCRSDSWRGPFVEVKTGSVPREVIASAKHSSRRTPTVKVGEGED